MSCSRSATGPRPRPAGAAARLSGRGPSRAAWSAARPARRGGLNIGQRPAFLLREDTSRGCGARSAPRSVPCSPCSANTTPAISRVVARREEHEPAVVAQVQVGPPLAARLRALERDHLRRAGLAATRRSPAVRAFPPVPPRVHDHPEPVVDARRSSRASARPAPCAAGGGTGFHPLPVVHRPEQVRRHRGARRWRAPPCRRPSTPASPTPGPGRSPPRSSRPAYHFSPVFACFHSVDGTRPSTSFGRSMPLLHAEAEARRPLVDAVDADHVADRVEVHVARLLDRVAQVDACRGRPCFQHWKHAAVEVGAAVAVHREVGRDDAFLERGRRDGHLERRPGRVPALDRAVLQRLERVGVERGPRRAVDARGERVRVVGRAGST